MHEPLPSNTKQKDEASIPAAIKKRLWVLSEVYYPEEISTGYYLTSIAEGLSKTFDVRVLTGQPKHMSRGIKAPKRELRNGVEIYRASATTFDKNIMFYRLINMFTIGMAMLYNSLKRFRSGDHILVVTAPPTLPITTALAALIKGASYTILVQDSYPEILIAVGATKPDSIFVRIVNFINRVVYKHASKIIVMGRDMQELFLRKTNGLDIPIVVIPNWADLESIEPRSRDDNTLLQRLGLVDKFILLYAGNIGHPTDVESIIESAAQLAERDDIHFLFIGAGAKKQWVQEQVVSRSLENVTVLDYMPRSDQIVFLNACDIGLIALIAGMKGTAMPSRTYNIMAVGKPILAITEEGSELAKVIDEENIGWHVSPHSPDKLTRTILDIYENRSHLSVIGSRAREAALNKYSLHKAIEDYAFSLK
jgi:colanic acid biosynthesis glycosyl transferase WcaI